MRIYENNEFKLCEILTDLYCIYNDNHRENTLTIPLLYDFQEQQHKRKDKDSITEKWLISEIDKITKLNWITNF